MALAKVARKRSQQWWSALLSRIAKVVQLALGGMPWVAFVTDADAHYKAKFVATFRKPVLRCV